MSATPARGRRLALLAACALSLAGASAATAAPTISGADGDVWNASRPEPTYIVTASNQRLRIFWQLPGGRSGSGRSPVTVTAAGLPDGTYRLQASEGRNNGGFFPIPGAARSFRIDTTPPTITITRPAAGSTVLVGASVLADYACAGAVSCAGPVPFGKAIDTAAPGGRTFRVLAVDDAGNEATGEAGYTVTAPDAPAAPLPAAPSTAAPSGDPPAPFAPPATTVGVAPPRPAPATGPGTINARMLHPRRAAVIATRRPILTWPRLARARFYNVQIFRVRGAAAVKVLSAFPRGARYRVPLGRIAPGDRYAWRVWPYFAGGYSKKPLGLSFFDAGRPRSR